MLLFYDSTRLTFRKLNEECYIIEKKNICYPTLTQAQRYYWWSVIDSYFQTFLFPLLAPVREKDLYVK